MEFCLRFGVLHRIPITGVALFDHSFAVRIYARPYHIALEFLNHLLVARMTCKLVPMSVLENLRYKAWGNDGLEHRKTRRAVDDLPEKDVVLDCKAFELFLVEQWEVRCRCLTEFDKPFDLTDCGVSILSLCKPLLNNY